MTNATVSISDGAGNVIVPPMDADEFNRRAKQIAASADLTARVVKKKLAGKGETPMAERDNKEMFSAEETGESTSMTVAAGQLRAIIERIERLEEEKAAIAGDIKEIYAEAKGTGFDTKAIRTIVRLRKKDASERQEEETILDLYKAALGMV